MKSNLNSRSDLAGTQHHRLNSIINVHSPRMAQRKTSDVYVELPLEDLKKTYTTEAQKKFLNETILKQPGRPHPQDCCDLDMLLMLKLKCAM